MTKSVSLSSVHRSQTFARTVGLAHSLIALINNRDCFELRCFLLSQIDIYNHVLTLVVLPGKGLFKVTTRVVRAAMREHIFLQSLGLWPRGLRKRPDQSLSDRNSS